VLRRRAIAFAFGLGLLLGSVRNAHAQQVPALDIALPPASELAKVGPVVSANRMLGSASMRDLLLQGFPAQFHFRVELWSAGGLFNSIERSAEYEVYVHFLVVEKMYEVVQLVGDHRLYLGKFARIEDAERAIARPTRVAITALNSDRRQYFNATLDVEVLQISDLDELNQWLHGELKPAVGGKKNPGTAISHGVRTLVARLLGGEIRSYESRTPIFQVR
jgi:hypothetical protein